MTETPYEALYALRSDAFLHASEKERMAEEAKAKGFRTFKLMYKNYEMRQKGAVATGGFNVTEFDGQPMELETGPWTADEMGITRGNGEEGNVACVHPIMPVSRLVNVDTGIEKLELAYKRGKTWRRMTAEKRTLASANLIVGLSDHGIAVTSESAKALVRYLHDVEYMNYERLGELPSVGRLGHIPGHGFSPYVEQLVFDGDQTFRDTFDAVKQRGDFELWRRTIAEVREHSIAAKILIAASFASALVDPFGLLPFFVHLWGTTSGTGKTVALMAAGSVWADPAMGRYIKTFDSTSVGFELYAGFLNSLPMIIDELQLSRDERGNSKFNVYKLAEGVGRLRGNKTRGVDKTITWRNCILTSGETPLTQDNSGAGALNRVIDIECNDDGQKIVEDGRRVAGILRSNYGMAGRMFVERLTEDVLAAAQEDYNRIFAELSESDATDKQALSAAIIITADRLVSEWFFGDKPIDTAEMSVFLKTNATVDINERAYAYLCDWVSQNANRMKKFDENGEVYGLLENGWAYIIRSVFNRVIEGEGYSSRGFLGWLRRRGLIQTRGQHMTIGKRIGGVRTECVCLRLPDDDASVPF